MVLLQSVCTCMLMLTLVLQSVYGSETGTERKLACIINGTVTWYYSSVERCDHPGKLVKIHTEFQTTVPATDEHSRRKLSRVLQITEKTLRPTIQQPKTPRPEEGPCTIPADKKGYECCGKMIYHPDFHTCSEETVYTVHGKMAAPKYGCSGLHGNECNGAASSRHASGDVHVFIIIMFIFVGKYIFF